MRARGPLLLLCLAFTLPARSTAAQARPATVDTTSLQRLLVAEDARGTGPEGLRPLLRGLESRDTLLRRLAVRGLGRLQRPELGRLLLPMLADSLPGVRAEAANAVSQSLRRARRGVAEADTSRLSVIHAAGTLETALGHEPDWRVADAIGQSLGRLPLPDSAAARTAETTIRARVMIRATRGLVHGLYTLARARRLTGNLEPGSTALLRRVAVESPDSSLRRLSLLTLATAEALDSGTAVRAVADRDDEVRRMALRGSGALSPSLRASLIRKLQEDPSAIVRIETVAAARLGGQPPDCGPILTATRDRDPYVALAAIDSLGSGCADRAGAAATLRRLAVARVTSGPQDHRWQVGAHAVLALARLDTAAAMAPISGMAESSRWEVRQYAARAAAVTGSSTVLYRLAHDVDHNVQEAAIFGLFAAVGHVADSVFLRALGSPNHQVALAAAEALKGTTDSRALPALLDAFDALSAGRSENAKDPRVSMLQRIGELGSRTSAPRLRRYLADFDTTVATMTATTLTKWTGDSVSPHPAPLPIRPEPLAEVLLGPDARLRVTMATSSGGGSFTVRLLPSEAPATVARVVRLVRERFYDGKVFQRVEPNFVIQGGGPDANEYVGDSTFMRDELTRRTHARGTLGISARGRDTGDGQWFINLVDNPLLDHEFTIFGVIETGRAVAERILEGDRIGRVEVVESP